MLGIPSTYYGNNVVKQEQMQPQFEALLGIENNMPNDSTLSDLMDMDSDRLLIDSTELMKYLAIT